MNRDDRMRIHRILDELNFPSGRYMLAGSGVMVLHGIDRHMRDMDIYVPTATWFSMYDRKEGWNVFTTDPDDKAKKCDPPYLYKTMHGIEVNIFYDWRKRGIGDIDVNFWFNNVETVDGVPTCPIKFLLEWKEEMGRAKDSQDITAIREHLGMMA